MNSVRSEQAEERRQKNSFRFSVNLFSCFPVNFEVKPYNAGREANCFFRYLFFLLLTSAFSLSSTASAAEDDIMDIRGMRGLGFWEANWHWAVPAIVGSIIVLGIIIYFASRKKPEPPLTAYQLAKKELNEASMEMTGGDDKTFSFAVSDALRHYLEGAFRIRAPEQTTEEFLETAKGDKRIGEDALTSLAEFLALCDLAKFARHAFGDEEREKLLSTAKEFVERAHAQRLHAVTETSTLK